MPGRPGVYRPPSAMTRSQQRALRMQEEPWQGWYKTARWQRLRRWQLQRAPLCFVCEQRDPPRITPATIVHHIHAHKGDATKFWDTSNLSSVCKPCHDTEIQASEREGRVITPGGGGQKS